MLCCADPGLLISQLRGRMKELAWDKNVVFFQELLRTKLSKCHMCLWYVHVKIVMNFPLIWLKTWWALLFFVLSSLLVTFVYIPMCVSSFRSFLVIDLLPNVCTCPEFIPCSEYLLMKLFLCVYCIKTYNYIYKKILYSSYFKLYCDNVAIKSGWSNKQSMMV